MTKFVLYIATSVDGYIARSDGSIDWLPGLEALDEDENYIKFYESIDAIVMGYTTYQQVWEFGYWPYSGKLSYVLSNQNRSTTPTDVIFMHSVEEVVEEVKKREYQRVWLMGGGKLFSSFMNKNLVDEFFIFIVPIILGSGISLYQSIPELKLKPIDTESYPNGDVGIHYQKT